MNRVNNVRAVETQKYEETDASQERELWKRIGEKPNEYLERLT